MDYHAIWFILIVVLFVGYVVLDGFDLGVGMSFFQAKTDAERRILLNSIGPLWDGNEVWLITAGGALFAAFPDVYATVFSGFYTAFMLFLLVLITRAVSLEFRSKVENITWRKVWDALFNISSYLIILLLGVSFGNIASGIPIDEHFEFAGNLFTLLNPYAIYLGLSAIVLIRLHGKLFLLMKTEGELFDRIKASIFRGWIIFVLFYIILFIWTSVQNAHLLKIFESPIAYLIPIICFAGVIGIPYFVKKEKYFMAFVSSSLVITASIVFVAAGLFPNFVLSNPIPANSLTAYDHSSSELTLHTMFIIAMIGIPLVLAYQIIVLRIFRGKVKIDNHSY